MCDDYQTMQKCIDHTIALELEKGLFRSAIRRSLAGLHRSIELPELNAPDRLTTFAIRYIQVMPRWLRQLERLFAAGRLDFSGVRELITRRFSIAPQESPGQRGLASLLGDTYLAHRTLEEINEQLQPVCGMPLLPMDTMVANLVVRELIGERLATELDHVGMRVGRLFSQLQLGSDDIVAMILCRQHFIESPGAWPDFAAELGIGLRVPMMEFHTDTLH